MGLLTKGEYLDWDKTKKFIRHVKDHGISQFINIYKKYKDIDTEEFYWGDEVEYIVLKRTKNGLKVSHNGHKVIKRFEKLSGKIGIPCSLVPEYGSFMIESTPKTPYKGRIFDLKTVEKNMFLRRLIIEALLEENEVLMTISNFPLLGTPGYSFPPSEPNGPIAKSKFISDRSINPHPRFTYLTKNIRERRGSRVNIEIPAANSRRKLEMDAMAFGMGCCCLQVTLQGQNMGLCRFLYDQLVILSPIFLALTASTPFHKGEIAATDVRWSVISQSVDCRTPAERGEKPLMNGEILISKSRFSPVSTFLSLKGEQDKALNDIHAEINKECLEKLVKNDVDEQMARHIAHLFIRDPLVISKDYLYQDDSVSTLHFENIQSTNWQTCRMKPPNPTTKAWRVEFRAMEIQLTNFENAAFSVFIVLLSRAILHFRTEFYIKMSDVYSNMHTAHQMDAVRNGKFLFRTSASKESLMGIKDIVCGDKKNPSFLGLIGTVRKFLHIIQKGGKIPKKINSYLDFVSKRASGELKTTARWMRDFVNSRRDEREENKNRISNELCTEMLERMRKISIGEEKEPELLGEFQKKENFREHLSTLKESLERESLENTSEFFSKETDVCDGINNCIRKIDCYLNI